jgi:hypothetical protein
MPTRREGPPAFVKSSSLRSVNIEQDFLNAGRVQLLPTRSIQRCLALMLRGAAEPAYRAQILTGAYGSGKSAVALAMARLLDARTGKLEKQALASSIDSLGDADFLNSVVGRYRLVTASARKEALGSCLLRAVGSAFADRESILRSSGWTRFARDIDAGMVSVDDPRLLEQLLSLAQQAAQETGKRGLILIVDELGQVLEHAAEHPDSGDAHLLQVVAEAAVRSDSPELWFLGVLHGEGAELSDRLGKRGRDQWRKVEQRFVEIPCVPEREDTMRLVSAAVLGERATAKMPATIARLVASCQPLCPVGLTQQAFARLCADAYPLHPTVLLALPLLAQSFGQSHRSVLSFIFAPEPHGFQEWCSKKSRCNEETLFGLPDLYDYICAVLPIKREADASDASVLADAQEVLTRLGTERETDACVVKTIAVMDLIGGASGLKPSQAVLELALTGLGRGIGPVLQSIKVLEQERHIVFRPIGSRYHVWQGSDVDLAKRAAAAHEELDSLFNLTETVQALEPPADIAARRHSIDTGVLRVIPSRTVSVSQLPQALREAPQTGIVLYCLTTSAEQLELAQGLLRHCTERNILGVVARDNGQIAAAAEEVAVLDWIMGHTPELEGDRAARREMGQRISEARAILRQLWTGAFGPQSGGVAYWRGSAIQPATARRLRAMASDMCDEIYSQSPKVRNELLNCNELSSQAAAARHSLVEHMVTSRTDPVLQIDGYPPERSMYECVLRETGIHQKRATGEWGLGEPSAQGPSRLFPAWHFMEQLVRRDAPTKQTSVGDIVDALSAPPFGLTLGLLSVIVVAFILGNDRNVSVYENGVFAPRLSTPVFERMLKSPGTLALGWSGAAGARKDVVARLARGLGVAQGAVPVVRGLLERISALPAFSLYTHRVQPRTLLLRQVLTAAKSPERLLYIDLPIALGCQPVSDEGSASASSADETAVFFERLNEGLADLSGAYGRLLESVGRTIRASFGVLDSDDSWRQTIHQKASLYATVATDEQFRTTLLHAQNSQCDDALYLESLAATLVGLSPREWTDETVIDYGRRASALGVTVLETEARLSLEQRLGGRTGLLVALRGSDGASKTIVLYDSELTSRRVAKAALEIRVATAGLTRRERQASLTRVLADSVSRHQSKKGAKR